MANRVYLDQHHQRYALLGATANREFQHHANLGRIAYLGPSYPQRAPPEATAQPRRRSRHATIDHIVLLDRLRGSRAPQDTFARPLQPGKCVREDSAVQMGQ